MSDEVRQISKDLLSAPSEAEIEEDELEELNIAIDADAYDAVLVAAFGGATMNVTADATMQVHPVYFFLLVLPLFSIQLSLIMFIGLDFSPIEPVREMESTNEMIFKTKLLIAFVLQLTLFKEMLQAVRKLVFMMNPGTWTNVVSEWTSDFFMYKPWVLAPLTILTCMMKGLVCYMVMSSSVSIILTCRTATDAIFDGLAITFISDLDETFWGIYKYLFNLGVIEGYPYKIPKARGGQRYRIKPDDVGQFITFVAIFFLYLRQLTVIIFAIITNVLPIARDLCTFRRWLNGEAKFMGGVAAVFRFLCHQFLVLDPGEEIRHKGEKELGEGKDFCQELETDELFIDVATEPKYRRMMFSDVATVFQSYPAASVGITLTLFFILVFPQLIRVVFTKMHGSSAQERDDYSQVPLVENEALKHELSKALDKEFTGKPKDQIEQEVAILKVLAKRQHKKELAILEGLSMSRPRGAGHPSGVLSAGRM